MCLLCLIIRPPGHLPVWVYKAHIPLWLFNIKYFNKTNCVNEIMRIRYKDVYVKILKM